MKATEAVELERSSNKDPKVLLILQDSKELQRLVAAWPSLPKDIERLLTSTAEAPVNREHRWTWLWGLVEYDPKLWLSLALLADNAFNRSLIEKAITLKLVFPDGTLQAWVDRFVAFVSVSVFSRGKKGKKDKDPEVTEA